MHRLTTVNVSNVTSMTRILCLALIILPACGGKKKAEDPSTKANAESSEGSDERTSTDKAEKSDVGGSDKSAEKGEKKDACVGFDIGNLEDLLAKSDCEVPNAKPETLQNPDVKGKLEVLVTASPTKVAPGGKADLFVTFANKTKEPLTLNFRLDPLARFETEVYDSKKKRTDMPAGKPPPAPKGHAASPPAELKVAKVTVSANGSARVRVPWEAVKTRWAPDKVRGTPVEKGYPRVPAGPLPKGKYTVRVVTPLIGVFEGADHEVSAPKVDVEVGR